jgi:hypothetical protein
MTSSFVERIPPSTCKKAWIEEAASVFRDSWIICGGVSQRVSLEPGSLGTQGELKVHKELHRVANDGVNLGPTH